MNVCIQQDETLGPFFTMTQKRNHNSTRNEEVTSRIFTLPNIISFARLCLIPIFLVLLLDGRNGWATFIFAFAASTDWVDGQLARHFGSVSKLGQLLDPAVDRLLMISGVIGLFLVGRLPLWIIVLVIVRDLFLLVGGAILLKRFAIRIPVSYLGKTATTFLYIGFAVLLINWPIASGLGVVSAAWLPGFSALQYCPGIWLVYIGLFLSLCVTLLYTHRAKKALAKHLKEQPSSNETANAVNEGE